MYRNDDFMMRRSEMPDGDDKVSCTGGCGSESRQARWGVTNRPVAMVYAPIQEWRSIYDCEMGLNRGTIFAELDLPFVGCKGCGGVKNG